MNIVAILTQLVRLFLILCLGAVLSKVGILDPHTRKKLTKLMLYVTTPLMILDAFNDRLLLLRDQPERTASYSIGLLFLIAFLFYVGLSIIAFVCMRLLRVQKPSRGLFLFMTIFGNVGFMGFPVVEAVCGSEGLFYAAIINCIFNIFIYTVGSLCMTAGKQTGSTGWLQTIQPKRLLCTPGVICCFIAVLFFSLRVQLPSILAETFDSLGGLTSPLAMLVVGANLSGMRLTGMLCNWKLNCYILFRQFAIPVVCWCIIRCLLPSGVLSSVLFLMAAMPIANMAALFATEYHADETKASQAIFLSTACSLISLPLLVWICC